MDPYSVLERDGQHPERKRLAHLGLGREGETDDVVDALDLVRVDGRKLRSPIRGVEGGEPSDDRSQALALKRGSLQRFHDLEVGLEHVGLILTHAEGPTW